MKGTYIVIKYLFLLVSIFFTHILVPGNVICWDAFLKNEIAKKYGLDVTRFCDAPKTARVEFSITSVDQCMEGRVYFEGVLYPVICTDESNTGWYMVDGTPFPQGASVFTAQGCHFVLSVEDFMRFMRGEKINIDAKHCVSKE